LSAASLPYYWFLAYFSTPSADRPIYREIASGTIRSIVEIGVGGALRAERMLLTALRTHAPDQIRYAGLDLFEARPIGDRITLKNAHRLFTGIGLKARLVPGEPLESLPRMANVIGESDLVVISADCDRSQLAQAWRYLPRMLHAKSLVYFEESSDAGFRVLTRGQVEAGPPMAAHEMPMRRAA
jgi:hypothetical protein